MTASGLVPSPSAHPPPPWPARGGPGNIEWWREGDDTGHRRAVRALDAAWGAVNFCCTGAVMPLAMEQSRPVRAV